jgi:hypothetical protein
LDPVRRALKPLLPPELYAFFDNKKLFLSKKEQEYEVLDRDWTRADRKKCFVDTHKKYDRLVFSADKMATVGFVLMEGRVRLHIERMHTAPPLVRQSAAERALVASVSGGLASPMSPDGGGGGSFAVGGGLPDSGTGSGGGGESGGGGGGGGPAKSTQARQRYSPGKMVSITTKLLPLNDFDNGSVVFLGPRCYGPRPKETKKKVVRIGGGRADSPDNLPPVDWSPAAHGSPSSPSIAVPKRRKPPPPWCNTSSFSSSSNPPRY